MPSRQDYDAIIIGGGHNGLVAACYLAQEGRHVAVIERLPHVGGMTSSWCAIPEAPKHVVHPYGVDVIMMRASTIVEDLGLTRHGYRTIDPDPPYVYLHPDGSSLAFWRDPAKTAEEIRTFSPADARAYLKFVQVLDALLAIAVPMMGTDIAHPKKRELWQVIRPIFRHRRLGGELMALVTGSPDQVADEYFEHPVVQAALLGLAAGGGPIDRDGNGLSLMLLGMLHRIGSGRPVGGIQLLPDALASRFTEIGGTILTGVAVEEIMAAGGRATGVRLADGRVIEARAVVASCDPRTAVNLVTPGAIERRLVVRANHSAANAAGISPLKVDLALSGRIDLSRHRTWRRDDLDLRIPTILFGTAEEIRESYSFAMRGEFPPEPFMWAVATSGCDPSQAPEGQDVVYLYPPAMPVHPKGGWTAVRDQAVASVIRKAGAFIGGLDTLELGRRIETPEDLGRRLNVTNGCITHIDFGLLRTGLLRPAWGLGGAKPMLDGFFLCGAGMHPGGGIIGLSGKIAAARVSKYLGRS